MNDAMNKSAKLTNSESGMVSLLVTFILMIVISITVLGFAQVVRRAERQALDTQLSKQAFYAAESGINTARSLLAQFPVVTNVQKTNCAGDLPGIPVAVNYSVDTATNTSVTCLLVDSSPLFLEYSLNPTTGSRVIPLKSATGAAFSSLTLTWSGSPQAGDTAAACNSLANPADNAWSCSFGLIRVDLIPESAINNNRNQILGANFAGFFYPANATQKPASVAYGGASNIYGGNANQGAKVGATCSATRCVSTITGLSAASYYMRVSTIYRPTVLDIAGSTSAGGTIQFQGAQVRVDSTGKAQDVLRRVQAFLPLTASTDFPDYALETVNSLCKHYTVGKDNTGTAFSYNYAGNCN